MEIVRPSPLERILGKIGGWFVRQRPAPRPDTATLLDLYNGGMFAEGNFFHRQILTHWAERIRADETHLETLRIKAQQGLFIYVTRNIGQLELIVLNNVLSEQKLPSPFFNNALRARRWLPLKKFFKLYRDRIGFLARHKNFPDPAANGFPEDLVLERRSILYSLEEWDPEFIPEETRGFLEALFEAEKKTG
ncbi:MAG: hypothetical protein HY609_01595, partial [Deltaproteobacteria bacterium]|nr:hypothetical protein [Deltaproteobacteria bacterium]